MRFVFATLVAAGLTVSVSAQPPLVPKDGKVVIPISLKPTAPPKPLSSAYLLPEAVESIPGNRVQMFLRSFMEQDRLYGKEESEKRQKWNEMPLKDLPVKDLKDYAGRYVSRDLYDAARMDHVDWQLWYLVRRDGHGTLLPDLQKMRQLADVLKTLVRGEIAAGDTVGALRSLKVHLGLAKTLESNPTLIGHLVGVAITTIACNALDELVQADGCPNLFWSLTDLPTPFLDLRPAVQGERVMTKAHFDRLLTATGPLSDTELTLQMKNLFVLIALNQEGPQQPRPDIEGTYRKWAADAARVEKVRASLLDLGFRPALPMDLTKEFGVIDRRPVKAPTPAEIVHTLTPLQVVITGDILQYTVLRDELFKGMSLPYPQAMAVVKETEAAADTSKDDRLLGPLLVPDMKRFMTAQVRLEQRFAYLRVLEAIRLYAFQNGGALPTSLDAIKLPLPADPVTGKPFDYSVKDGVATLHGASPNPDDPKQNRYYEITIRK
jgi:hypothetical protein